MRPYLDLSDDLQYEELKLELETAKTATQLTVDAARVSADLGAGLQARSRISQQATEGDYLLVDYPTHILLTVKQNLALAFSIDDLFADESKVVVISDFKENIELVQRHKEPQQLHWNKPRFAYLSFVVLRVRNGKLAIEYLDPWSLDTSHDFAWLLEAWQVALKPQKGIQVFGGVTHIEFFSDNGPPFHSSQRARCLCTNTQLHTIPMDRRVSELADVPWSLPCQSMGNQRRK
jgi:hypothetical protein